jgi:sugar lactone lactonase YvrE
VLADLAPGLDNSTFVGDRLFVSNINGSITEILDGGKTKALITAGFNFPLGLAMGPGGTLFVADGPFCYLLESGRAPRRVGFLFDAGYPGYSRGVAAVSPGEFVVTTANGDVARFWPQDRKTEVLAKGVDQLYGLAVAPRGAVVFAEQGAGRVHAVESGNVQLVAAGLRQPCGVAIAADDTCFVTEAAGGRVVRLAAGKAHTVLDGLTKPQGIAAHGQSLYVLDVGTKQLIECDLAGGSRQIIAGDLPVGAPPGVIPKVLGPVGTMSGPMGPFAGLAVGSDGTLYVSADAEGSVLAIRRSAPAATA